MKCCLEFTSSDEAKLDFDKLKEYQEYCKNNFQYLYLYGIEFEVDDNHYLKSVKNAFYYEKCKDIKKFIHKLREALIDGFIYFDIVEEYDIETYVTEHYMITPEEVVHLVPVFVREDLSETIEQINKYPDKFDLKKKEDNNGIHVNNKD